MEQIQQAIYLFIKEVSKNLLNDKYIFRANQNVGSVGKNDFIIYTILGKNILSTPVLKNKIDENLVNYDNINLVNIQVDFYGETSLEISSIAESYLNSRAANDFFKQNNLKVSTYICEPMVNMTAVLDNKNFVNRYVLRFTLFSNFSIDIHQTFFDNNEFNENFNVYLVQNDKVIK